LVEEIRAGPTGTFFATIDEFFEHLDTLVPPEDRPAGSEKKVR